MLLILFLRFAIPDLVLAHLSDRAVCPTDYTECRPDGATPREVPVLGGDWSFFYQSLLTIVPSTPDQLVPSTVTGSGRREVFVARAPGLLCCAMSSMCILIPSYDLPTCYDKFTTDYYLNDGSYGTISNGSYTTSDGGEANLISGDFTLADGTKGNIYAQDPADKPDIATMPMPVPFTSSGVGGAIPGGQLGTVTTTSHQLVSKSGVGSLSTTSAGDSSTNTPSPVDTASNGGIVPPFITDTLTGTPSIATGTIGFPHSTSTAASGTAPGLVSGTMFTGYTSSAILPPISNVAAVSILYCIGSRVVFSIAAALLVG